jgi:hypothetical protein
MAPVQTFNLISDKCIEILVKIKHRYIGFVVLTAVAMVTDCCFLHALFFPCLVFDPEDGGVMFLRNVTRLNGITSQNIELVLCADIHH